VLIHRTVNEVATLYEDPFGDPLGTDANPGEPGEVPARLLELLNDEQKDAVTTLGGPLLVVAGPGSGKTRVLTHRIAALVSTDAARPFQILAVTFTNKAAAEMRERLATMLDEEAIRGMWVSTFHSACLRLLRANPASAGLPVGFTVIDSDDAKKVMRDVLAGLKMEAEPSDAKKAAGAVSAAKNTGSLDAIAYIAPEYAEAAGHYQKRLAAMGSVDFDDILLLTLAMLKEHSEVLVRYRRKFRHILVDEFQDTNGVQYEIVRLLAEGSSSVCVVGDFDQSVYSWRGATPEVIADFTKVFPGAKVVKLGENYRSTPQILEVCQAIIDANPAVHRVQLRTSNAAGEPVRMYIADDDREEVRFVVNEIRSLPAGHDAAVLMRTNAQTRLFEEELTRNAVPYAVVGALKFYDRAEIKDALAYLKLIVNPRDIVSFARVVNTPRRGLGTATVDAISSEALTTGIPVVEVARLGATDGRFGTRSVKGLVAFAGALEDVATAAAAGPGKALMAVLKSAGLRDHFTADKTDGPDRLRNLGELVSSAETFCENPASVTVDGLVVAELGGADQTIAFLENVALVAGPTDGGEAMSRARVLLMTAHAAKGKEFDHVWVVGVEDSLFPHYLPGETPNTQEERRLLFVACSRARKRLTISRSINRMVFGRHVQNGPSELVDTLPESVQEIHARRRVSLGEGFGGSSWSLPRTQARTVVAYRAVPGSTPPPGTGPRILPAQALVDTSVTHPTFGDGVITEFDGQLVTVKFGTISRILRLDMAPLSLTPEV
jgi:DNA helicase-2/ATP-dependent DNA helicase PcrA